MKEIGGYLEFEQYHGCLLHETAIKLNCGRNALAYLLEARQIKELWIPYFLCDSIAEVCAAHSVKVVRYPINRQFEPEVRVLPEGAWLYVVNYYGQLEEEKLKELVNIYGRVIMDYTQDYYRMPVPGVDTLYTCRKYFGVPDGAMLYTDAVIARPLEQDLSYERIRYVMGRFETSGSAFYAEASANNVSFAEEPVKRMSRLTENLLRAVDYPAVAEVRTANFQYLHQALKKENRLSLRVPKGAFMYPFYVECAQEIRHALQKQSIYIPVLWPEVLTNCQPSDTEYAMAQHILPLPVDQRYGREEMDTILQALKQWI